MVRKGGSAGVKAFEVQPRLPQVRGQEKESGIAAADVRFLGVIAAADVRFLGVPGAARACWAI